VREMQYGKNQKVQYLRVVVWFPLMFRIPKGSERFSYI